ncbi:hypothetical protein I0E98_01515 [Pseudomonas lalucatii]|nr:hypothetical protein [Pseudomonas lalucatii]
MFKSVRKMNPITALGVSLMLPLGAVQAEVAAVDINALQAQMAKQQAQMAALQEQIEALKSQQLVTQNEVGKVSENIVTRTPSGDLLIGETTLAIGGYIKAQSTLSSNGFADGKANEIVTPGSLRAVDERQGAGSFSARQSRFNIGTSTPLAGNTLTTFVEVDFYGADDEANEFVSNSYAPRLRHAYGSWGNWLAGQTWSTFMDLNGLGELMRLVSKPVQFSCAKRSCVIHNRLRVAACNLPLRTRKTVATISRCRTLLVELISTVLGGMRPLLLWHGDSVSTTAPTATASGAMPTV